MIPELTERTRDIFRRIVDLHLQTGEPVGSSAIAGLPGMNLSPASIRNVMADLEKSGLLYAPHKSAGRLPTEIGLKHYVNGILEIGNLSVDEQTRIKIQCQSRGKSLQQMLTDATSALSGLSRCAGIVAVPKGDSLLKHIEFVTLAPGRALVVLVFENGQIENRMIDLPLGLPPSSLIEAGNYLSYHLVGKTVEDARHLLREEMRAYKAELDQLTAKVVEAGLVSYINPMTAGDQVLVVRGQANLLDQVTEVEDLAKIRHLMQVLESRDAYIKLLDAAAGADGMQIFIGADNELFSLSGCSLIAAPFRDQNRKVIGTIGIIGPTRMNYGRIIPMVDYTAKVISNMLEQNSAEQEVKHAKI
ncbi:MAG: heat-inducible transcriptional repressor HrcA [Alphaproteobacteria bacterium]|nr:MAG: heat-inducible transcriptional repressor HrcA [Alphaproteobacteria bacterium]